LVRITGLTYSAVAAAEFAHEMHDLISVPRDQYRSCETESTVDVSLLFRTNVVQQVNVHNVEES